MSSQDVQCAAGVSTRVVMAFENGRSRESSGPKPQLSGWSSWASIGGVAGALGSGAVLLVLRARRAKATAKR